MTRRSYGARLCNPESVFTSSQKHNPHSSCPGRKDIPRNFLDNLPHELGALAQVTLGPADSWLDDSGLGFLYA